MFNINQIIDNLSQFKIEDPIDLIVLNDNEPKMNEVDEITEILEHLSISDLNVANSSDEKLCDCVIIEKIDQLSMCDSNESNQIMEDIDMSDEKSLLVEREPIIELLDLCFPNLKDDSSHWSAETYWEKMKEYTNIDLDTVMEIYRNYQAEDENNKEALKRQFIDLFIPAVCGLE